MELLIRRFSDWLGRVNGGKATAPRSHSKTWRMGVYGSLGVVGFVLMGFSLGAADFAEDRDRLTFASKRTEGREVETVRVMSWNVKAGALFPASMRNPAGEEAGARVGRFGRILRAVRPDVLCLQEIWPLRKQSAILEMLNRELSLEGGEDWSLHREVDVVIASRYPLVLRRGDRVIPYPLPEMPDFHYGQAMCLVDLPDGRFSEDLFVITAHFRSRSGDGNVRMRERHADSIAKRIQDLRSPGGQVDVKSKTPILVAGDFNVYDGNLDDPKRHLKTLISGRVGANGAIESPDWDLTDLKDLFPSINGAGKTFYTWRNDQLPYPPGALDRVLFTDSVLFPKESFVLNTTDLSAASLEEYGMERSDSVLAGRKGEFDHLPIVADFELQGSTRK